MGSAPGGGRARPQLKETEFPKGRLPERTQAHDFLEHRGREVDPAGENAMPGGGGPNPAFDGRTVPS